MRSVWSRLGAGLDDLGGALGLQAGEHQRRLHLRARDVELDARDPCRPPPRITSGASSPSARPSTCAPMRATARSRGASAARAASVAGEHRQERPAREQPGEHAHRRAAVAAVEHGVRLAQSAEPVPITVTVDGAGRRTAHAEPLERGTRVACTSSPVARFGSCCARSRAPPTSSARCEIALVARDAEPSRAVAAARDRPARSSRRALVSTWSRARAACGYSGRSSRSVRAPSRYTWWSSLAASARRRSASARGCTCGMPCVDPELAGAQQRHVAEPERPGRGGRELGGQVVGGGEDDADEVVVRRRRCARAAPRRAAGSSRRSRPWCSRRRWSRRAAPGASRDREVSRASDRRPGSVAGSGRGGVQRPHLAWCAAHATPRARGVGR